MSLRKSAQAALEALHIGEIAAEAVAKEYHAAMHGYRQARHDAMDRDVQTIRKAIEALRDALAEAPAALPESALADLSDAEISHLWHKTVPDNAQMSDVYAFARAVLAARGKG